MNEILINAICTLIGAIGLKAWDTFFSTKKESKDSQIELIEKMQVQIDSLNKRQDELQLTVKQYAEDATSWKDKYYKLLLKYSKLSTKYQPNVVITELEDEVQTLGQKTNNL
jgi:hypothetical protein